MTKTTLESIQKQRDMLLEKNTILEQIRDNAIKEITTLGKAYPDQTAYLAMLRLKRIVKLCDKALDV